MCACVFNNLSVYCELRNTGCLCGSQHDHPSVPPSDLNHPPAFSQECSLGERRPVSTSTPPLRNHDHRQSLLLLCACHGCRLTRGAWFSAVWTVNLTGSSCEKWRMSSVVVKWRTACWVGWVLLCVHRNRRFFRDGSPGRPPWLSHSSWALSTSVQLSCCEVMHSVLSWLSVALRPQKP